MAVGAYPGTFNPPTVAHVAVAEAAWSQCRLERIDLVVSRRPLGKEDPAVPALADRIQVLEEVVAGRPWLGLRVTDAGLIVDVARGYDVVVLGADKWMQVLDPGWYGGSTEARDDALSRLPRVVVAPRCDHPVPPPAMTLDLATSHLPVSSTGARSGRIEWMLPEAAAFDEATGAWSDPDRYRRWARSRPAAPSGSSGRARQRDGGRGTAADEG